MTRSLLLTVLAGLGLAACDPAADADAAPPAQLTDDATAVVDSVIPMDIALERFRGGLTEPAGLAGGADSRDRLVERFVAALASADTAEFETLALDRAEFAWLYYPTAREALPPYELPPSLAWFRLQQVNRTGVLRALRELGGRPLEPGGYMCDGEPAREGRNRIWIGCRVTLAGISPGPTTMPLFGAIVERDGHFKFVSYANDF